MVLIVDETGFLKKGTKPASVKLSKTRTVFVLLTRRWVVERSLTLVSWFQQLAKECECLPEMVTGWHLDGISSRRLLDGSPLHARTGPAMVINSSDETAAPTQLLSSTDALIVHEAFMPDRACRIGRESSW
ncbi:MAG: hypothetical protein M3439_11955 [Chloroflexota bacterium]|nr:hypothetical protein [Chloroflexota bacterium]